MNTTKYRRAERKAKKCNALRVVVSCTNKVFYLNRRAGRPDWWIRFRTPKTTREATGIKVVWRSTGQAQEGAAVERAKEIIASYWPKKNEDGQVIIPEQETRKQREDAREWATVPQIIDAFRKGARTIQGCLTMRDRVIEDYIRSWIRIITARFDKNGALIKEKGVRGAVAARTPKSMPVSEALDIALWQKFQKGWMKSVDGRNPRKVVNAMTSVAAYINHARSMFAPKFMPLYEGLKLPDLSAIRALKVELPDEDAYQFEAIDEEQLRALESEIESLRTKFDERDEEGELTRAALDARGIWIGYYLAFETGLRRGDILNARKNWIGGFKGVPQLKIGVTDHYIPKAAIGSVSIDAERLEEILKVSGARFPLDFLIPGTDRAKTLDLLSEIVRKYVGDRRETLHALRGQAISIVADRYGLDVAAQFARHKNSRITRQRYRAYLRPTPVLAPDWREKVVPISAAQ